MYSAAEYTAMLFLYGECGGSARAAALEYAVRFPNAANHPSYKVILKLVHRSRTTGQLRPNRKDVGGVARTARTVENEEAILDAVANDGTVSIRQLERNLNLSRMTIQRVLRTSQQHPYHYTRVQELLPTDYAPRRIFCQWILDQNEADPNFLSRVLFSDEALFSRDGTFNYHNYHVWAEANPRALAPRNFQRRFSINVWAGIIGNTVIGPIELPPRLTGEAYLEFLRNQLHVLLEDVPIQYLNNDWFQHDGAPPHFSIEVRALLDQQYPNRWIGRGGPTHWPARSPDITPLDYFLWGHIKNLVYRTPVNTREELWARIINAFATVTPEMLQNARQSMVRRAHLCIQMNGGHFQQLL